MACQGHETRPTARVGPTQSLIEDKLRGRVFGTAASIGALMTLLGMTLAGTLGDRLGPVLMLNIQGGMYALSGVLVLLTLWGLKVGKMAVQQRETMTEDERAVEIQVSE